MQSGEKGLKMESFETIISVLSKNVDETFSFLMSLADIYSNKGDFEKAFYIRETLLTKELSAERRCDVLESFSKDFHKAGMYENAIQMLKEVLVISDEKDKILDLLSHLYIEIKDWNNTINCQKMKKNKNDNFIIYSLCQWSKELLTIKDLKRAIFKLKEAEIIDEKNIHVKLHKADILLLKEKKEELIMLTDEIANNFPDFFGIFLNKYFQCFPIENEIKNITLTHLKKFKDDAYTAHIYIRKLIDEGKYEEAYDILNWFLSNSCFNIQLCKSYIETAIKLNKPFNSDVLSKLVKAEIFPEKWFRCKSCGYESEAFSFLCIRCNNFDVFSQIKVDE